MRKSCLPCPALVKGFLEENMKCHFRGRVEWAGIQGLHQPEIGEKKKQHKAQTEPKSKYIDTEKLEAQENTFLKKFILCVFFLGPWSWFHLPTGDEHELPRCKQRNGREWEMCSNRELVTHFRREVRNKQPRLAYSMPLGFTKKESYSKDSRSFKVGRQWHPTKRARQIT